MVERIEDMPAGTVGFRATDALTEDDFRTVMAPVLREAVTEGGVRLLLVTPPDFGTSDVKDLADRARAQLDERFGHRSDWKRIAIVTDSSMLRRSSRIWSRLVPVETRAFAPDEEPEARRWLADG
jgi:hypothetical protein